MYLSFLYVSNVIFFDFVISVVLFQWILKNPLYVFDAFSFWLPVIMPYIIHFSWKIIHTVISIFHVTFLIMLDVAEVLFRILSNTIIEIFWVLTQLTFTCSKSTIETLEKGAKYVSS